MAYATGTSANYTALFDDLIEFLTENEDLVTAGEEWEEVWSASATEVVLKGKGTSGSEEIFLGFRLVASIPNDSFSIHLFGMSGVIDSASNIEGHINVSPFPVKMFVDSSSMAYWFTASGRRFTAVVKISTVFETLSGGFFLPYANPISYSYPLYIGGSAGHGRSNDPTNWRSTSDGHSHFPYSFNNSGTGNLSPSFRMLTPTGEWVDGAANEASTTNNAVIGIGPSNFFDGLGAVRSSSGSQYSYNGLRLRQRSCFGGDFTLTPFTLVRQTPADQTYGILDGAFQVPGFGNSSENIITINSVDHLVVQNAFRTGIGEYWALALE